MITVSVLLVGTSSLVIGGLKDLCEMGPSEEFKNECDDSLTNLDTLAQAILPDFLPKVRMDAHFVCTVLIEACYDK
jgi:hypothetical protein